MKKGIKSISWNKHIPPVFEICTTFPWTQNKRRKLHQSVAKNLCRKTTHPLSICWSWCGCIYQHLQGQAGLGRTKRGEGPIPRGVTAFCHTLCSITTTRWHFHKIALLNYAAWWKGKKKKSGCVRKARGRTAHFLGVCSQPKPATCFHQLCLPFMQSGIQDTRGTIKLACCFCSLYGTSVSFSLRYNDTVSPLRWPPPPLN